MHNPSFEMRKISEKKHRMNWLKLIDPLNRVSFNEELEDIMSNCTDLGCYECCRYMVKATSKLVKKWKSKDDLNQVRKLCAQFLKKRNAF